ncbi:hybrid sensor histidine kinase/response regulator [Noviherbaspirillum soli]|uniref:hybrid sensor histidine kinase/response regulator n=1 Tax=Noviherbaspirillum soli TaxID=1064518 RepID=UPI00188B00C3|nr:ATP-binding protein [Noviherbaspirillum soli]
MTSELHSSNGSSADAVSMAERFRSHDWPSTPLGPQESWPESLRLILDVCFSSQFPIAVWWGPDLIQFYNEGYRPILGATKHPQAFGRSARETWPEIWTTIGPMIEQVMSRGEAVRGEDMELTLERNGYPELCYFTFSYSPIRDLSGNIVGMFTAAVETTERVLSERRQRFQMTVADRSRELGEPDEVIAAATELLANHLNVSRAYYAEIDASTRTFHIPAKWTVSRNLPDLPEAGRIEDFSPALLCSLRKGLPFIAYDLQTDERTSMYAPAYAALAIRSIVIVPLVKSGCLRANFNLAHTEARRWTNEDIAIVTMVAERTWEAIERARAESALRMENENTKRAEAALRQLDHRKNEFLAMLAHELRNPLAPISAAADLLRVAKLDEARISQTSRVITRQVAHLNSLVDDLMDVSRVTRGLVKLNRQLVDAKRIIADAVEQVGPLIEARRHQLVVHTAPEAAYILGDYKRLVQVLTNLLHNAAKYTPEGGHIVLRMEVCDGQVSFMVADNGVGMQPDLVKRAFELFVQGERTPDRSAGGLGIGLALVKSLVELHQGKVSVVSRGVGTGSEFTVMLPRVSRPSESYVSEHDAKLQLSDTCLRLMVVDDNVDAAQMLGMLLQAVGHQVSIEHESQRALERARIERPDACLLDIGLPDMDGNELARRLRAQHETAGSLLIAITGYGQEHDREVANAAGFDHHFVKPIDTAQLIALLSELVDDKVADQAVGRHGLQRRTPSD